MGFRLSNGQSLDLNLCYSTQIPPLTRKCLLVADSFYNLGILSSLLHLLKALLSLSLSSAFRRCYFFYVPAVQNLARFLWAICQPEPPEDTEQQE
jgi:hypothetical protein